jgi:hypothetical protein
VDRSKNLLRPGAETEVDRALRELGNEVLEQDIPERLLDVLRAAAAAANKAKLENAPTPGRTAGAHVPRRRDGDDGPEEPGGR